MPRTVRVLDIENPGQSYTSERKRVRIELLKAHPQFREELTSLMGTLQSYSDGFNSAIQARFESRWRVTTEVAPSSAFDNSEPVDGDPVLSYRENLSQRVNDAPPTISEYEPIFLFWDSKYTEAIQCSGEVDLTMVGEHYVAVPMTMSLNEAIAFLNAAGVGEEKSHLTNTDEDGLKESVRVFRGALQDKLKIPDIVRRLHSDLNPETFKSKSTRYTKLLKQMLAIVDPPPRQQI